jgi:HlyD family secretion protein
MSRAPRTRSIRPHPDGRKGFTYRGLLLAIPLVVGVPLLGWLGLKNLAPSSEETGPMMHTVGRGKFVHDVIERGNVESANNVEIRCEVESHGAGTMILWVIPEGTYVTPDPDWKQEDHPGEEPPDLLVRLDSSSLEDQLTKQQITCNSSAAAVVSAESNLETAKIGKEEYIKGKYEQAKLTIESKIFVAKEELRKAEDTLEFNKEQLALGYVSELAVQASEFAVEKTKKDLLEAETDLKVLEEYTKRKQVGELDAAIAIAQARLESERHSHQLDEEQLQEFQDQIDKCAVRAPQPGQVVYANITDRRGGSEVVIEEGTMLRERQVIIRLPDPKDMQVKARINEARVAMVKAGMPTSIRLDAFPDLRLHGVVEKVSEYPLPSAWYAGNVKEYETIIKINDFPEGLQMRAGMTAEVRIRVEQLDDALTVPVQAILEHGQKHYCVVRDGEALKAKEVVIGSTNDKDVVIQEGVQEGDRVVMGAALYRDKLGLPKVVPMEEVAEQEYLDLAASEPSSPPSGGPPASPGRAAVADERGASRRPGGAKRDPSQMFSALDANGDGRLDGEEIPERIKENLSDIDANNDGAIDRSELAAMAQRFRGMRGRREPGGGPPGDPKEPASGYPREGSPGAGGGLPSRGRRLGGSAAGSEAAGPRPGAASGQGARS